MNHNYTDPVPRTYYKAELALAYNESMTTASALRTLNKWIELSPGLTDRLAATGYRKTAKILTPIQVRLIFEALGEP